MQTMIKHLLSTSFWCHPDQLPQSSLHLHSLILLSGWDQFYMIYHVDYWHICGSDHKFWICFPRLYHLWLLWHGMCMEHGGMCWIVLYIWRTSVSISSRSLLLLYKSMPTDHCFIEYCRYFYLTDWPKNLRLIDAVYSLTDVTDRLWQLQ